jgi:hypothetical protein
MRTVTEFKGYRSQIGYGAGANSFFVRRAPGMEPAAEAVPARPPLLSPGAVKMRTLPLSITELAIPGLGSSRAFGMPSETLNFSLIAKARTAAVWEEEP